MMKIKPANPKGVRDFLPEENARRSYIIQKLEHSFRLNGFENIYIPAFERFETLSGKYGEEGDKLFFKILNSGNFLENKGQSLIPELIEKQSNLSSVSSLLSDKGLRYDHTVPLARFVSQHQNELTFPFKRYVIGPVWRADRPQKGRYQEFFQCDIDVVGASDLMAEIEVLIMIAQLYSELGLKVTIKVNHRKIFGGICSHLGLDSIATQLAPWIDKWDKIGTDKLVEELSMRFGEYSSSIEKMIKILDTSQVVDISNADYTTGLSEIERLMQMTQLTNLQLDLKLVRGLDYYTGCVFEVVSNDVEYGSIGGGGRYDNLTEIFGLKNMNGFGFSFGLDRIYDVMNNLNLFPEISSEPKVIILNIDIEAIPTMLSVAQQIRNMNMVCSCYPMTTKLDKQLSYIDKKKYDYAIIIGSQELADGTVTIKNLTQRTQKTMGIEEINFDF